MDAALEGEAAGLEPASLCADGSFGYVSFGGAAGPACQSGDLDSSPAETVTLEPATMQRIVSGIRQGQRSDLSSSWLGLMTGSAEAGCTKPGQASKRVRFVKGAFLVDFAAR